MLLHLLPCRSGGAAENMATDFLLLRRYPAPEQVRLRHYGWHRPACTFGYSQRLAEVRPLLPPEDRLDLCRRFSGGGIVDHRDDWTYLLVLPRGHTLEAGKAPEAYRVVHEALATALRTAGQDAEVKPDCDPATPGEPCGASGVCFRRAERFDVIHPATGAKIAGAAMKRTREGLALQGSLWRPAAPDVGNWETFLPAFAATLAPVLRVDLEETAWPELSDEELSGLTEQYSAEEWLAMR